MKSLRWFLGVLAYLIIVPPALAQDADGDWHGTVKSSASENQLVIHIRKAADSRYAGSMDIPDLGVSGIPLETIAADGRSLVFTASSVGGAYRGTWDPAQNRWKGEWTRAGATSALDLARGGAAEAPQGPFTGLDGNWDAVFVDGQVRLRVVLRIKVEATGTITTLDSPDQGISGLAVSALRRNGAAVRIEMRSIASVIEATLDVREQVLTGNWVAGGKNYPIAFNRRAPGASDPVAKRPQTPVKPYPYREEEVEYENPAAKVRLAGTLTVPTGAGPFPAVLLIAGSGDLDRDETINDHKVFLVLADHLTRQGIAVLRVDKRGVGKSTGDYGAATTADFASDAEAGVAFLKSRPDINRRKIGLAGHSEGGLIAPLVASRDPSVAFVVLLAAPGVAGIEIGVTQYVDQLKAMGTSDASIAKMSAVMRNIFTAMLAVRSSSEAAARAREMIEVVAGCSRNYDRRSTIGPSCAL